MKFAFYWDITSDKISSDDVNFYLFTEFDKKSLSGLSPYQLFPDREFYQSLLDNFHSASKERIHFYNYIYTSDNKRIRISGTAEKDSGGYRFSCEIKKVKNATIEEVTQKNSLLSAVNEASLQFLNEQDWQKAILPALNRLRKVGDYSYLNLWQFGELKKNKHFLRLSHSTLTDKNTYFTFNEELKSSFEKLRNSQSVILHNPVELFESDSKTESQLFLPVLFKNYFWGVLEVGNYNKRQWDSDEILALESFAKILSSAIKSSVLYNKLKDAYGKLNLITETTGSVLYSQKKDDITLDYISQSAKTLLNADTKKLKRSGFETYLRNDLNAELTLNTPNHKIFKIDDRTGKTKYICNKKFNWTDPKGNVKGELGILQDVTERIEFENQLARNNSIFTILNDFTQKVLVTKSAENDLHTLLKYLGEKTAADRIYLFTKKDSRSEYEPEAVWLNLQLDSLNDNDLYKLEFEANKNKELLKRLKSGRRFVSEQNENWNEANSSAVFPLFVYGDFYGFIGFDSFREENAWDESELSAFEIVSRVISAAIELESFVRELTKAKKEAEKSDRLKSEFIAQISHEIRSPVNVMLSFLGMLWEEMKEEKGSELTAIYDTINKAAKRLVRSIDLLIESSEIQSGIYQPDFKELNLIDEILEPAIQSYKFYAEEKGLKVIRKSNNVISNIYGDSKTINVVIDNLLSNAVKYTNEGSIEIKDYNKEDRLIVEIIDSGEGISEEYLDNIFKPFSQENEGYARKYDGMGLGMFIVKNYCKLNKIELGIETSPGEGTKFILEFPLMDFWHTAERRESRQD